MAAYRAVLRQIFPGRDIICALGWTQAAQVVILPSAVLETYAPGSGPVQASSHARDAA